MNRKVDDIGGCLLKSASKQGAIESDSILPDAVITMQLEADAVTAEELG
jgi:hypothetical protein